MGIQGLPFQTVNIPFAAGLYTKGDKRAGQPPSLEICTDVEFDDVGGLRHRYPFATTGLGNSIAGGGTISDARQIVPCGNELLLFTKDTLYSWNAQQSKWVSRGTHLAVSVDEETVFGSNGDQVTPDRAELNGTIVYAWTDSSHVYVAALDKTTGSVMLSPTKPTEVGGGATRPRLIAMASVILLFLVNGSGDLVAFSIDPASPATGIALSQTSIQTVATFNTYYDVVKIPGADSVIIGGRRQTTTSYTLHKVTSALAVTSSTKGRTCDGPIAVSCEPTGTSVQVVRANGTNVQGDLITISTLADVYTAQAIGTVATSVIQIAAAHRSVQNSSHYRCYVFWEDTTGGGGGPVTGFPLETKYNWVDDGNNLGTQATLLPRVGPASRAFDYNGSVYFWVVFAESGTTLGAIQPSYILVRDDTTEVARASYGNAYFQRLTGNLSGVSLVSGSTSFAWCGTYQRSGIGTQADAGFHERAPRDVTFTFDSNDARRTARLGDTMYIPTAEGITQYDGTRLAELSWHVGAYSITLADGGAGGAMGAGTFTYKPTLRWMNGRGEVDRSSSFGQASITQVGSHKVTITGRSVWTTRKVNIAYEYWRTAANPTVDSPFYLVTNNDPSTAGSANGYLADSLSSATLSSWTDNEADATTTTHEENPEDGGVLEAIPPPPCKIVHATQDRLFIAGIAGQPDAVWYSKLREIGFVAQFNDALTLEVPKDGGDITGLAFLNETLIVFRETAIYAFPGAGFDNTGGGSNYGPARTLTTDVGAIVTESIALVEQGLLFQSRKGWRILNRGWGIDDVGLAVSDFDDEEALAVHVIPDRHQVRILTASRMLVWDTLVNQWGEWSISDGIHACIWNGEHLYLTSTGPKVEQDTHTAADYGWDVETAWIKPDELQGRVVVLWMQILGEYRSDHSIQIRVARDYKGDGLGGWDYFDDKIHTPTETVVGGPLQFRHGPSQKRCEAIKLRLTATAAGATTAPSGIEAARLTGLALRFAPEQGPFRNLSSAQKT